MASRWGALKVPKIDVHHPPSAARTPGALCVTASSRERRAGRFPDKDALIDALFEERIGEVAAAVKARSRHQTGGRT
jgi:hypothetical protein